MRKILLIIVLCSAGYCFAQQKDSWDVFAKTKFESRYSEKAGEYLFYPRFTPELKALEGKLITMEGYYVPFAPEGDDYIILSKYPMSQCFFCGGGGAESVAEVHFSKGPPKFRVDDLIMVRGKLKLNETDMDHLNFILLDAEMVND